MNHGNSCCALFLAGRKEKSKYPPEHPSSVLCNGRYAGHPLSASARGEGVELPEWFEDRILPIDLPVSDRWGRLQQEMNRPIPVIDSLIAATALHYDLRWVTRNRHDFKCPGLQLVCPWDEIIS